MKCEECQQKEKRIAELEGLLKRMSKSADRIIKKYVPVDIRSYSQRRKERVGIGD